MLRTASGALVRRVAAIAVDTTAAGDADLPTHIEQIGSTDARGMDHDAAGRYNSELGKLEIIFLNGFPATGTIEFHS